ncbi:NF-kappa-B essential modulator isoform X2 [Trichomycterus rosablanca]|uniref:NF-kappa-B essential modulator isoform X2 n=1 Tax=Trichomycterus rosablanca TaxID=2290929 RepID=UPI002F358532
MVQPQSNGGSNFQWEMAGEEAVAAGNQGSLMTSSQGSLRVPPELAGNELVHRLLSDNHQLREALKRSNDALKDRCEEMEGWQRRSREEREFLNCKFHEARSLVVRLGEENQHLQSMLNHNANQKSAQSASSCTETKGQNQNLKGSCTESKESADSPVALNVADQKNDAENTERQTMPRSLPSEGSNDFLRLLKSHKEKLEEGMKDLKKKNEELLKEKMEWEKEKEGLQTTVEQLYVKLTQLTQSEAATEEAYQRSSAYSPDRYKELLEKVNVLHQNTIQRDINEALLKQKKDYAQLTKDSEALRAQVKSLLGELQERQTCLERCEGEKKRLDEILRCKMEDLQTLEREMEQQKKQHSVAVDKLLMQTQNLEAALKNERSVTVDERRKLAQLQHAYTCLFQDYDNKLKTEKAGYRGGETETLTNRLEEAEKALALKQGHIDKLKEQLEQKGELQETITVLTAQADIFKSDFLAERRAREELNQKKEELQEKLNQSLTEVNLLKQEKMQQRHVDYRPLPHMPPPVMSQPNRNPPEVLPEYQCPKCNYNAPDMDTLQIHVMDCIQ